VELNGSRAMAWRGRREWRGMHVPMAGMAMARPCVPSLLGSLGLVLKERGPGDRVE
jgi:hypothetical protein